MIACFLSNISAKHYKNLSMLSRVIAENVRHVFFETQCSFLRRRMVGGGRPLLPEILGQPTPVGAKSPIFNR